MDEDELEKIKFHTHLKIIKKEGKDSLSKTFSIHTDQLELCDCAFLCID